MKNDLITTYSIGLKLRTLRQERRLTLSRLAVETGFSTGLLSKLETDIMIPTLQTLAKICQIYGVGLGYFFSDVKDHSLVITREADLSNSGRAPQTVKIIPLHLPAPDSLMTVTLIEFPPGTICRIGEHGQRNEIAAHVIKGKLEVNFAGNTEILEEGDCAVLSTSAAGAWSAAENSLCRALVVTAKRRLPNH